MALGMANFGVNTLLPRIRIHEGALCIVVQEMARCSVADGPDVFVEDYRRNQDQVYRNTTMLEIKVVYVSHPIP